MNVNALINDEALRCFDDFRHGEHPIWLLIVRRVNLMQCNCRHKWGRFK